MIFYDRDDFLRFMNADRVVCVDGKMLMYSAKPGHQDLEQPAATDFDVLPQNN
jgi:hypothetical protein